MTKTSKILLGVLAIIALAGAAWGLSGGQGLQGKIAKTNYDLSITNALTQSQVKTVSAGEQNVTVGEFVFTTDKNEVEVQQVIFKPALEGTTKIQFENVRLVDGTAATITDPTSFLKNNRVWLKGPFVIPAKTSKVFTLVADIKGDVVGNSKFTFVLETVRGQNLATKQTASTQIPKNLKGSVVEVKGGAIVATPSLTLSLAATPVAGSTEHVKGEKKVKFVGVSAACGSASDCKVKDVTLTGDFDEQGLATKFTAGESNSVKLNSIVGSVWLEDSAGAVIAAPKPVQSSGAVNFTQINWTVKKGEKAIFYVVGDISTNGYANGTNDNISFVINAASDVIFEDGSVLGSAHYATNSVNADNKVYATVIGGGSLSINLDSSTPKEDIVIGGAVGVPVSTFKATSTKEPYVIKKLALKNRYDKTLGDTDNNINSVKISYTNSQGQPETKTGSLTNGKTQFAGLDMLVPKDSDAKLQVTVNFNSIIQGGGGATAGEMISIDVTPENFEAVSQTSGETLKTAKFGSPQANFMHVYSAKPVFTLSANSASGSKTVSTTDEVFSFGINNTGKDEITIKNLVIDIAANGKLTQKPATARLKSGTGVLGLASVEYTSDSSAKLTFDDGFTIPKDQLKQLTLEVSTIDLMSLTPGEDSLIFSIDYGSSVDGNVTPGDVTWENKGKLVQWLGYQSSDELKSNVLKY